ncbi:HAMP domain-containing histidine kinase [Flavimobilis sp. GY10621]|uniref:Sensor histidine kinase MtrB n=1 Tax=Flavimobilis rhizosphaerae TaxID=2775421 RepID=A0ABR9DPB7_9MICO|nr:MtrAB system histidine kinase MtrB [Flavimobilis rhizosphaerae]MBD9698963.1 HAMP domain-containing histidine kinase [Flavimobilis rhizosphaerae]
MSTEPVDAEAPVRLGPLGRFVQRWRRSIQVKVVSTALVVGTVLLLVLGGYLSGSIRDGVFDQRLEEVLLDSARTAQQAQLTFDTSTAATSTQVQLLLNDMLPKLRSSGTSSREVVLLRTEAAQVAPSIVDITTAQSLIPLISDELRAAVVRGEGQLWQSVAIPTAAGSGPGIAVGSLVEVPLAGPFELYFVYSLAAEQDTLGFIQSVLLVGAAALIAILVVITYVSTRQVVRPVQRAALSAERLAEGHLGERLAVRGSDEMATLGRSFNEMAASLQRQIEQMEALSAVQQRFVSDVSHELRTPLTTIRMAAEMINGARDEFDPVVRRSAELLSLQLDRFESLLADLLEISRFDAGAATLDAEHRDVRDIVDRAVDNAVVLAGAKGVFLSVDYEDTPARADVDPVRLERIVRNLLVNAIEHAEDGPVEVTVASDAHAVAVHVRDFGVGMTAEAASRVFDRFWRADPARARTTGGTGLGLAISLEDARLHGGWLEAWGRPGEGAAFRLTLPRRAGIRLVTSPVPLVPESAEPRDPEHHDPSSAPGGFGAASVPVLTDGDEEES